MGVVITGALKLPKDHLKVGQAIKDLTFQNPFEPDKVFEAFFTSNSSIIVPRGYLPYSEDYQINVLDTKCDFKTTEGYKLRDYQEQAVSEILGYFGGKEYAQCLLQAACSSGKTFMLSGLLSNLNQKTLILSHLSMLSTQMYSELSSGLTTESIKILESSDVDKELPDVAICTFQLLDANSGLLQKLSETYGLVIVDEAENSFTRSRLKVLLRLNPKYQLYLTATPSKDLMKQTSGLFYLFGDKIITMNPPEENKIHSHHLMVNFKPLHWDSPMSQNLYKTQLGKFMLKSGVVDSICKWSSELKQKGLEGCQWIIADLSAVQDYAEKLLVSYGMSVRIIRGTTSNKKRQEILQEIIDGKVTHILGSAPLAAGISIKELSVGWRLLPNSSSDELLSQQKGRLARPIAFKEYQKPIWIDIIISGNLEYGAKKRFKLYQQSTYGVSICKPEETVKTILEKVKDA